MAKVTPSPLVGSVQGAIGGLIFRGAGNAATVQARTAHTKSATPAQRQQRQFVSAGAAVWSSLDAVTQRTWDEYVIEGLPPASDSGQVITTGRAAFLQFYVKVARCGQTYPYFWPQTWPYRPEPVLTLTVALTGAPAFLVKVSTPWHGMGINAALARCPSADAYASRPIYRSLFNGASDGHAPWSYHPAEPDHPDWYDLAPWFTSRFPDARPGDTWQLRLLFAVSVGFLTPTSLTIFTVA